MSGIVCAIRGGPASHPTIGRAIDLAVETGLKLHFLFVVNLDFLVRTSSSRVHTISHEMNQMGEFILLAAQTSAAKKDVEAEGTVRHGSVMEEIIELCHEVNADYLVLGRPKIEGHEEEGEEVSLFTEEKLLQFTGRVEEQTGAKVVFPEERDAE